MKTLFALTLLVMWIAPPAQAQWMVYDPTAHTQQILDQAQNLAKYVEMVNNQVRQINALTSQLRELEQYNKAFGDPSKILQITGVNGLVQDLRYSPVGKTITELQRLSDGVEALKNNANGLYHNVGETFTTPSGRQVVRVAANYRAHAAIDRTAQNYTNVFADAQQRRAVLKAQIADTTEKLQASTTDAETQKLNGVLTGLHAALAATDKEIDQALGLTLMQQAQNQNDLEKQARARSEEQQAEFGESLQNYRNTFKLSTEPAHFPESK